MKKAAILITVICTVLSLSLLFSFSNSVVTSAYASPAEEEDDWRVPEEKTYSTTTIDEDFFADRVHVVLSDSVSDPLGLSEERLAELFDSIEYEKIEDTCKIKNFSDELLAYYEKIGFNQSLEIFLKEKTKENVLFTIKELEKLDYVLKAYVHKSDFVPIVEPIELGMPVWQKAIIGLSVGLVLVGVTIVIIILVRKRRKTVCLTI